MIRKKVKASKSGFKRKPMLHVVAVIFAIFAISAIAFRFKGNASGTNAVKTVAVKESTVSISIEAQEVVVGGEEAESSDSESDPLPEADIQLIEVQTAESETQVQPVEETQLSEVELEWRNKIVPNVEDYLVVRTGASKESEVIGKLYKGNMATIISAENGWLKIKSGDMEGFVSADYVHSGMEAYESAKKTVPMKAKNNTEGLRVRSEANTDSTILTVLEVDSTLNVNKSVETPEGWTAVDVDGKTGYVKNEFVELKLMTGIGITIKEENAIIEARRKVKEEAERAAAEEAQRKEAEAKKKKEEESKAASAKSSSKGKNMVVSSSEIDMLAAIIECEAGGEGYESKLAVGAVVVNRMQSSRFPNSMEEVLRQGGQFTPVAAGLFDQVLARGASSSCYLAARDALAGNDNTGGCLFFRTANGREGLIIENMVFY